MITFVRLMMDASGVTVSTYSGTVGAEMISRDAFDQSELAAATTSPTPRYCQFICSLRHALVGPIGQSKTYYVDNSSSWKYGEASRYKIVMKEIYTIPIY